MKITNFVLLILFISIVFSFEPEKLCRLNSSVDTCSDTFSFKCGEEYCSAKKSDCENLIKFKSYARINVNKLVLNKLQTKIIQTCPKVDSKNFCLKPFKCLSKKTFLSTIADERSCQCSGKYKFKCETNYCVINAKICGQLKQLQKSRANIKTCGIFCIFISFKYVSYKFFSNFS
jgi:hypothetical protein